MNNFSNLLLYLLLFSSLQIDPFMINSHGYWEGEDGRHVFDQKLASTLVDFFKSEYSEDLSIVDLGCGNGSYVKFLIENGLNTEGFDGNPSTYKISNGLCNVLDLSIPINLNKTYDWVISLEVGEHLPKKFETIFIENLIRHCKKGIVLSWALEGQGGAGHFNEQNNDYIKKIFAGYGFSNDVVVETKLREQSSISWFKNTIMVFLKTVS